MLSLLGTVVIRTWIDGRLVGVVVGDAALARHPILLQWRSMRLQAASSMSHEDEEQREAKGCERRRYIGEAPATAATAPVGNGRLMKFDATLEDAGRREASGLGHQLDGLGPQSWNWLAGLLFHALKFPPAFIKKA
jgi:hypothetical protein